MIKKPLLFTLVIFVIFAFACINYAKADELIIQDDGKVVLLIIKNNGVLGVETKTPASPKTTTAATTTTSTPTKSSDNKRSAPPSSSPSNPVQQPPAKTVPLVSAHTDSTVQIKPPINNDKKVQVIITTSTASQPRQAPLQQPQTSIQQPKISPTLTNTGVTPPKTTNTPTPSVNVIIKTVDQIVAQGTNGTPVLTIKSDKANQLTIKQGNVQVTTLLPLQIDTLSHSLSVPSQNTPSKVFVLPTEALQGVIDKGYLNTQSAGQAKINLTNDQTGVNYTVQSELKGKLFGIIDVKSPVEVKLSAQTGKVVKSSQSVLFNIFSGFIK